MVTNFNTKAPGSSSSGPLIAFLFFLGLTGAAYLWWKNKTDKEKALEEFKKESQAAEQPEQ